MYLLFGIPHYSCCISSRWILFSLIGFILRSGQALEGLRNAERSGGKTGCDLVCDIVPASPETKRGSKPGLCVTQEFICGLTELSPYKQPWNLEPTILNVSSASV
jgi:hypothetical protein